MLNELWKDAPGAVSKCTVAGTPGTWKQMLPAAVTADPSSGTIPTGYLILNVTQGTLKRHTGGLFVGDHHRSDRWQHWFLGRGACNAASGGRTSRRDAR